MIEITEAPIDHAALTERVRANLAGAVCTFLGTVRELTGERRTAALEYEAYPEMASKKLAEAAAQMAETPSALQLRLLQTVMAVAAEKNSTLVLPIPVELLRFLERGQQAQEAGRPEGAAKGPAAPAAPRGAAVPTLTEAEPEREARSETREAQGERAMTGKG